MNGPEMSSTDPTTINARLPNFARVIDVEARAVPANDARSIRFTIATLVTDPEQYGDLCASFQKGGFTSDDCEYLVIDNTAETVTQTGRQTCAYRGLNAALNAARGQHVILCHQDVRLHDDNRKTLEARVSELDRKQPAWALAGNAGAQAPGKLAIRISDPHGQNQKFGTFPARVMSLDENFIVVRAQSRAGFSRDLTGFHFYGADICLNAAVMGWDAFVIDFHLDHLSPGNKSESFEAAKAAFRRKWSHALRPRWLQTTCSLVRLGSYPGANSASPVLESLAEKITRRLPFARGWNHQKPSTHTNPTPNPGTL